MMVVPPTRTRTSLELGPRYGIKGCAVGAFFGAALGVIAFMLLGTSWCFLVVPLTGVIGYLTRRIVRMKPVPQNVMW